MTVASIGIGWLLHPDLQPLLRHGAPFFVAVVAACVFAESGLLIGFFLPGDSLLFSAGLVVALGGRPNIVVLLVACMVAAAVGDQVGYAFGHRVGPALFRRPDARFFRREHLRRSEAFFDRHGARALILARFVPVVRTFTPVLAGVSHMRYRTFVAYNIVGAALWASLATLLGYALGRRFPGLDNYLTPALLVIVLLSVVPVLLEFRRGRVEATKGSTEGVADDPQLPASEPDAERRRPVIGR